MATGDREEIRGVGLRKEDVLNRERWRNGINGEKTGLKQEYYYYQITYVMVAKLGRH